MRSRSQGQARWHTYRCTHRQAHIFPLWTDMIFLNIIKPQSALYSHFSQQLLSWMQRQQASRDRLHIKTAPDELWSVLIVSGSPESLILLTTASDDVWGKLHLTGARQPECLYNYQQKYKVTASRLGAACVLRLQWNMKWMSSYRFPSCWIIISLKAHSLYKVTV